MAKVKMRNRWVQSPPHMRSFSVRVEVGRHSTLVTPRGRAVRGDSFMACARVVAAGRRLAEAERLARRECAYGKNPRKAVQRALAKIGSKIGHRRGAFRGYRRRR